MVDWRYILSMSIWQEGKYDDILFVDLQILSHSSIPFVFTTGMPLVMNNKYCILE